MSRNAPIPDDVTICSDYLENDCNKGNQCRYFHPPTCQYYPNCRYGRDCDYYHPGQKMKVDANLVGAIIGRNGAVIKPILDRTGARASFNATPPQKGMYPRILTFWGPDGAVREARTQIECVCIAAANRQPARPLADRSAAASNQLSDSDEQLAPHFDALRRVAAGAVGTSHTFHALSGKARARLHEKAGEIGLKHESKGQGVDRHLVVTRVSNSVCDGCGATFHINDIDSFKRHRKACALVQPSMQPSVKLGEQKQSRPQPPKQVEAKPKAAAKAKAEAEAKAAEEAKAAAKKPAAERAVGYGTKPSMQRPLQPPKQPPPNTTSSSDVQSMYGRAPQPLPTTPAQPSRRALLVGINNYSRLPLRFACNDARAMDAALQDMGFETILVLNCTAEELRTAKRTFCESLQPGDTAFFYFAGHGVEASVNQAGKYVSSNWLISREMPGANEDLPCKALDANSLLTDMELRKTRLNVLVFDCCRDNPLPQQATRSLLGNQLGRMDPCGSLVAFSCARQQQSEEKKQLAHGVFTRRLLEHIKTPGLTINDLFTRVGNLVEEDTQGRQRPWKQDALRTEGACLVPVALAAVQDQAIIAGGGTKGGAGNSATAAEEAPAAEEIAAALDLKELGRMKVQELKELCKQRGLSDKGIKADLVARLFK